MLLVCVYLSNCVGIPVSVGLFDGRQKAVRGGCLLLPFGFV